jgi:glycine oxidase
LASHCDLKPYRLAVLGGGSWGLAAALAAVRQGLRTCLVDVGGVGGGASNGVLGALMPHTSGEDSPLTRAQLGCILDYERFLRADCGLDVDAILFSRPGRVGALFSRQKLDKDAQRVERLAAFWRGLVPDAWLPRVEEVSAGRWTDLLARPPVAVVREGVTARLDPRLLMRQMFARVRADADVYEYEGAPVLGDESGVPTLTLPATGRVLACDRIVVACGFQSATYLPPAIAAQIYGHKGQALLCKAPWAAELPMLYQDRLFFVPHGGGLLGVGSVSTKTWTTAEPDDQDADQLFRRLSQMFRPELTVREVVPWSAIRPGIRDGYPLLGRRPDRPNVMVATGGHKIGLGLLPLVFRAVAAFLADDADPALAAFDPQRFLASRG